MYVYIYIDILTPEKITRNLKFSTITFILGFPCQFSKVHIYIYIHTVDLYIYIYRPKTKLCCMISSQRPARNCLVGWTSKVLWSVHIYIASCLNTGSQWKSWRLKADSLHKMNRLFTYWTRVLATPIFQFTWNFTPSTEKKTPPISMQGLFACRDA